MRNNSHFAAAACGVSMLGLAASAVAAEAAAPADGVTLDEIVITAQKRTERLSDVPVAASVVSLQSLSRDNAGDISDLNNIVPSVDLVGSFNGRVPMGIRGISSNASEATVGLASGVAIMIDGVPVPSDSNSGNQLEDIKSVEVLKGPQATLGGRTASAGIINIVTRAPTDTFTANVSATATSDDEYRFSGFVGGPVTTGVSASLSAYGNVRRFPIINDYNDDHSNQHNNGLRGKIMLTPNDDLDVTFMADYHTSFSHGGNFTYSYVTPGASLLLGVNPANPPPPPVAAAVSQAAVLTGITPSRHNDFYNSPVYDTGSDIRDQIYSLNVNYRIGALTLGSTTAYQREISDDIQDLFVNSSYFSNNFRNAFAAIIGPIPGSPGTWADFNNHQYQTENVTQTSQEFKLVSPTEQTLSFVAGLFFSDQKVDFATSRSFTPAATDYSFSPDTKTYDVYGRATYRIADDTSLIAGLRFNSDHLSYGYSQLDSPVGSANSSTSSALVGDLSLQHNFDPHTMAYITYARGYAPKVFNSGIYYSSNAGSPTAPIGPTGQEHINDVEVGMKGIFLDQRLTVNADLFYTVYQNYQVQSAASIVGVDSPVEELDSAGKARTQGLEVDTVWAATDTLRIDFNAAYIDAKFLDYKNAPCWGNGVIETAAEGCHADATAPGETIQDVSGRTMPDSPKFRETLGAAQRIPLGTSDYEMTVGGTYTYHTQEQFQADQNPQTIQGGFGLLNLSVAVRPSSGKFTVTAFCNNVTNHFYAVDMEDFWSSPWNANAVVMQPARDAQRYGGVRFDAKW